MTDLTGEAPGIGIAAKSRNIKRFPRSHSFKSELRSSYAGESARTSWLKNGLPRFSSNSVRESGGESGDQPPAIVQYKLTSKHTKDSGPLTIYSAIAENKDAPFLTALFEWSFQTSYLNLIVMFMAIYTFLSIFFALLIMISHLINSECIMGPKTSSSNFMDAFSLSWATFSTVGYGHIRPNTAVELNDSASSFSCAYTNIVVAFEAFIGILFAGFCGAILFTKTLKSQREAQVVFSDPVCIHFRRSRNLTEHEVIPCPVMEFRIINKLSNKRGGEIIDAKVKCLMAIDSVKQSDAPQEMELHRSILSACTISKDFSHEANEGGAQDDQSRSSSISDLESMRSEVESMKPTLRGSAGSDIYSRKKNQLSRLSSHISSRRGKIKTMRFRSSASFRRKQQIFGEAAVEGGKLLEHKSSFSDIKMDFDEHPFFSRVWVVSHSLDMNSPLLKDSVKAKIRDNNGSWPYTLNSPHSIRSAIKNFDRLIFSINGTSNSSASEVFSRKVYSFTDMVIGYRFAEVTWIDSSGDLKIDFHMANVVRGQEGGGCEPL